jgi:hypothetical protein
VFAFGFLLFVAGQPADAQKLFRYQLVNAASRFDRFLGSDQVGRVSSDNLRLYMDDLSRNRRFAFEYENDDNGVDSDHGLELTEESVDLAGALPLWRSLGLSVATGISRFNISDDYWTFGLYPTWEGGSGRYGVSLERDADDNVHFDGSAVKTLGSWTVLVGLSHEQYEERKGPDEERYGLGLEPRWSQPRLIGYVGGTGNPDDEPTWTFGAARYASLESRGLNPAAIYIQREKPESSHNLWIVSLWGRALNEHTCPGMVRSFFQGSLTKSRVVRNRDFGTFGVGRGYDQADFGLVSASGTKLTIEVAPGVELLQSEYVVLAMAPGVYGPIMRPFVILAYDETSDLIYNPRAHAMTDPSQKFTTVSLGGSFALGAVNPTYLKANTIRVQADLRFDGGIQGGVLKTTLWF